MLSFDATDATYNCQPNALDFPIDFLEQIEEAALTNALMEGATIVAEVAALVHEQSVINTAVAATTGGAIAEDVVRRQRQRPDRRHRRADPQRDQGRALRLAHGRRRALWRRRLATLQERAQCAQPIRRGGRLRPSRTSRRPRRRSSSWATPKCARPTWSSTRRRKASRPSVSFLLDTSVLVFARLENPTRRDPSFMKTFRLMGNYMVPGSYLRDDGRVEVAKFDWSEAVAITNSTAAQLLTVS